MHQPFEAWHDFYLLQGGAAATLVALLFVAASVGIGYLTTRRLVQARAFMNPVVVHFTAVLTASAMALAPVHSLALFVGGSLAARSRAPSIPSSPRAASCA
jgi:hypothetical protein